MTPEVIFTKLWTIVFSPERMGSKIWPSGHCYRWTIAGRRFAAVSFGSKLQFCFHINGRLYGVVRNRDCTYEWLHYGYDITEDVLAELMLLI